MARTNTAASRRNRRQRNGWGGARSGAGRPRAVRRKTVSRRKRDVVTRGGAQLVTLRVAAGVPSLRTPRAFAIVVKALYAARELPWIRITDYTVMGNHIHLIVEAPSARDLALGMQSFAIRIAKGLNKEFRRRGKVFSDRFHSQPIREPEAARWSRAYVINNARRHHACPKNEPTWIDPYSSGFAFDGWRTLPSEPQLRASTSLRARATRPLRPRYGRRPVLLSVKGPLYIQLDEPEVQSPRAAPLIDAWEWYGRVAFDEVPGLHADARRRELAKRRESRRRAARARAAR